MQYVSHPYAWPCMSRYMYLSELLGTKMHKYTDLCVAWLPGSTFDLLFFFSAENWKSIMSVPLAKPFAGAER